MKCELLYITCEGIPEGNCRSCEWAKRFMNVHSWGMEGRNISVELPRKGFDWVARIAIRGEGGPKVVIYRIHNGNLTKELSEE